MRLQLPVGQATSLTHQPFVRLEAAGGLQVHLQAVLVGQLPLGLVERAALVAQRLPQLSVAAAAVAVDILGRAVLVA